MTTSEAFNEIERFSGELIAAVSERDSERLPEILEMQKKFVTDHLEVLDEASRTRIQKNVEQSLLLAKAVRAHCLDAILLNRRKLGILTAYQAG